MNKPITPPNVTLKTLIIESDLKDKEVAEAIGISVVSFSQKINEKGSKFSLPEAERIAKFFGKTIEEIFFS